MHQPESIGRYQVESLLGSGGFATVWLARDPVLDETVAIKVLADNWSQNLDVRRRFIEEAKVLWQADSDHVVRVHYVDETTDGRPYFVMSHADGGTFRDRMDDYLENERQFSPTEVAQTGASIARALAVVHAMGQIHRDVKPSNVLVQSIPVHRRDARTTLEERLVLADFGLAKEAASSALTLVAGSPGYLAPEQARGLETLDQRADLFPLGVILYEMLVGELPFERTTIQRAAELGTYKKLRPIAEVRPDTPPALAALITDLLAVKPADRPSEAEAVATQLSAIAAEASRPPSSAAATGSARSSAPPPPTGERDTATRNQALIGALIAVVALLAIVGGVILFTGDDDDPVSPPGSTSTPSTSAAVPPPTEPSVPAPTAPVGSVVPLTAEQLLPKPARAALDTTETNNSKKVFNWAVLEVADAPDPGPAALQIVEDEYRTLDQWTVSSRSGDGSEQPLVLELAGPGGNTGSVQLRYRSELGSPIVEITVRPATIAAT